MARNKLEDLRNTLFEQLERLNEEGIGQEEMKGEIKRAKAVSDISNRIMDSAKLEIQYVQLTGMREARPEFFRLEEAKNK